MVVVERFEVNMKKEIEVGDLVRLVGYWKDYPIPTPRWGIIIEDDGLDENGLDPWGRWTVVTPDGDYIGCTTEEIELLEEQ